LRMLSLAKPNHGQPATLVSANKTKPETAMSVGTILLIILILALIGAFPTWGHSRSWGYFPSGGIGLVLLIVIVLLVLGRI